MNAGPSARATQHQKSQKRGGREEYESSARSSSVVMAPGSRNGGIAKQEFERCTTLFQQFAALLPFERDSAATAAAPCGSAPGNARSSLRQEQSCEFVCCVAGACASGVHKPQQVPMLFMHADFTYRLSVVNNELNLT